tara:strand:- start:1331 stop:2191 length:861 start_codon:yes stop_codon:yes gene_type:complete
MAINRSHIFIGTSQFKSNYGLTNKNKNFSDKYFFKILEFCSDNKIINFDTAPDYNSEKLLGDFLKVHQLKNVKISTKIPHIKDYKFFKDIVRMNVEKSLNKLNSKIYTLFFHSTKNIDLFLKNPDFFFDLLKEYKIKKLGFSLYYLKEVKKLINYQNNLTLQIPFNIPNNTFDDYINSNKNSENLIFGRSLFLQGLLLQQTKKKLKPSLKKSLQKYYLFLKNNKLDPLEINLHYIASKKIKYYIFGIEKVSQIKQIINCRNIDIDKNIYKKIREFFLKRDVDPLNW